MFCQEILQTWVPSTLAPLKELPAHFTLVCEGKLADDQTFKRLGQARSKGRALLFLVSKQNLNRYYWHILHIKSNEK